MNIILIITYVLFCLLVAFAGRKARIGFVGVLIFSIFMTPLLVAILIMLFGSGKKKKKKKKKSKKDGEEKG
jgi:uncharacterized membrane protein